MLLGILCLLCRRLQKERNFKIFMMTLLSRLGKLTIRLLFSLSLLLLIILFQLDLLILLEESVLLINQSWLIIIITHLHLDMKLLITESKMEKD